MIKEYQDTVTVNDEGLIIEKDKILEERIVKEITKIVNAIIVVYKYYIFEDYEDLRQYALQACYTNFLKFTPEKGTAFDYFSIISKWTLYNYTTRRKKHRNHQDIADQIDLVGREEINYDRFFDEMADTLFSVIDDNFVGDRRKKYEKITSIIVDYLRKTKKFVSKSDLYAWARAYGVKNTEIREYVKSMSDYNAEIFTLVG